MDESLALPVKIKPIPQPRIGSPQIVFMILRSNKSKLPIFALSDNTSFLVILYKSFATHYTIKSFI
jgi:hypothetical protein